MSTNNPQRFPIRFDPWYAALSSGMLMPPSKCYVEVDLEQVSVQMGWAFRARFPRAAVLQVFSTHEGTISRGVHGFAGQWLVNGSGQGILSILLRPDQRAHVIGFPVRLQQLMVSVTDPLALATALTGRGAVV